MKKFLGFLCMTLTLFILGNSAWADTYTGSIFSSDDTMFASQDWYGDAELSWEVDDTTYDGYWTYSYNWSTESKDLSHIIIELSETFTDDDIFSVSSGSDPSAPKTYVADGSNPLMPGDLYGIKWDTDSDTTNYLFEIVSARAPMWGDFYAVDGKTPGAEVYAYNLNFGEDTGQPDVGNGNAGGWILVPDTQGSPPSPVSEPTTMLLLGTGLIGMLGIRRKRKK